MSDRLSFRLLGPFEAERGQTKVDVGGPKATALLALLLLRSGETRSTDSLIDSIWGDEAPSTARTALQGQVSRLRKILAADPSVKLITRAGGYALLVDPEQVDIARFEGSLDEGRRLLADGYPGRAADVLSDALALWRGEALEGIVLADAPAADIRALDERRREATRRWVEANLALGRHHDVLPELERVRTEDPLDESVAMLSALASYRAARPAEALEVLAALRRTLSEDLGTEPGPAVAELERKILAHDPSLDAEIPTPGDRGPIREGRKVVTALVVRLSSPRGAPADPEADRTRFDPIVGRLRAVIEAAGGYMLDPLSGRIAAVFGLPRTHEDDATRAATSALEIADDHAIQDAAEVRTGLATGEVLVRTSEDEPLLLTADPLDAADGLARAAAAGEVLASRPTVRLLRGAVGSEDLRLPDGSTAARLTGASGPRAPRRRATTLIGRGDEMDVLRTAFGRVRRERSCCLVSVIGTAGVGKTTVVSRFLEEVEDTVAIGRCLPYGRDITYWPIAEVIRRIAGIVQGDAPAQARAKVAQVVTGDPDATFVEEQLGGILGVRDVAPVPDELFWVIRRFLESAARRDPLVVVFEDIHWADATLLNLIEYLAAWTRGAAVLFICLARPELLDQRPGWGGGRLDAVNLPLEPLSDELSDTLLQELVGGAQMAREARRRILATAEGNPLFVEELFAMLVDEGLISWDEGRWAASRDLTTVPIPPTVLALLSARLDRLPAAQRTALERAGVVGLEFSEADLRAFDEDVGILGPVLEQLVRADLVVTEDRAPGTDRNYRFRHQLLRDAVYAEIPKETRAQDHALFALDLEMRAGLRLTEVEEILGYHLEMAWRYRRELGLEADDVLAERAASYLLSAGRRAFARTDNPGAFGLLGRVRELLADDDPRRPEAALLLAIVAFDGGDVDRAQRLIEEGLDEAGRAGDEAIVWRLRLEEADIKAWLTSEGKVNVGLEAVAREAIDVLGRLGDTAGRARAFRLLGDAYCWLGRWEEGGETFLQAQLLAIEAGDEREASERPNRGVAFSPMPVESGIQIAEAGLERSRRRNPDGSSGLGLLLAMAGRRAEALEVLEEATERATELGEWRAASVRMYHGFALLVLDEPETAERIVRPAVESLVRMGERNLMPSAAALLSEALYRQERYDEAMLASLMSEQVTGEDDLVARIAWRSTRAKILMAQGEAAEAERLGREAVRLADGTGFLPFEGDALVDLATVLAAAGKVDEAAETLRAALDVFARKGMIPPAERARETLQRLKPPPAPSLQGRPAEGQGEGRA